MKLTRLFVVLFTSLLVSISAFPSRFKNFLPRLCQTNGDCHLHERCFDHVCQDKYEEQDSVIMKENFCFSHDDCPSTYVCNRHSSICEPVTSVEQVVQKQTCKNVIKKFCTKSSQCSCNEKKMVCEDNECVYEKEKTNGVCTVHTDCQVAFMCDKGMCREPRTIEELMQMFQLPIEHECQVNSDCSINEQCKDGSCEKKKIRKNKIKKCLRNTVGMYCKTADDCNSNCGKNISKLTCLNNQCEQKSKKRWKMKKERNISELLFAKSL